MIFAVFQDHSKIIVTRLAPQDMQAALTVPDIARIGSVKPAFKGMYFIGVIGSDTALRLGAHQDSSSPFMTGIQIPEKYKHNTLGGCMALPVKSFIVAMREEDDLSPLRGSVRGKKILVVLEARSERRTSSTAVKKALVHGEPTDSIMSRPVREIIEKYGLYR